MSNDKILPSEIHNIYTQKVLARFPKLKTIPNLKEEQALAVSKLFAKKDVLAILPTGYGKTLIMILYGAILSILESRITTTIICSPLIALMKTAQKTIENYGFTCFHIETTDDFEKFISTKQSYNGDAQPFYVLLSPELLGNSKALASKSQPSLYCIDEIHLAATWGKEFRQKYSKIYEIRCHSPAIMLGLTGTLPKYMIQDIVKKTGLRNNYYLIAASPNRENIYLRLWEKRGNIAKESTWTELFQEQITDIKINKENSKKVLIFVPTVNQANAIFFYLQGELMEDSVCYKNNIPIGNHIEMFSSIIEDKMKKHIFKDFMKPNGLIRIVIATTSFSMGVDIPNVSKIIIFGLPENPLMLWQMIGRGGRNGELCEAIIMKTNGQIKKAMTLNEGCIRKAILETFIGAEFLVNNPNNCCSFCTSNK